MFNKQMIFLFAISTLRTAASLIKSLDSDNVGSDDNLARILNAAAAALEAFIQDQSADVGAVFAGQIGSK